MPHGHWIFNLDWHRSCDEMAEDMCHISETLSGDSSCGEEDEEILHL